MSRIQFDIEQWCRDKGHISTWDSWRDGEYEVCIQCVSNAGTHENDCPVGLLLAVAEGLGNAMEQLEKCREAIAHVPFNALGVDDKEGYSYRDEFLHHHDKTVESINRALAIHME